MPKPTRSRLVIRDSGGLSSPNASLRFERTDGDGIGELEYAEIEVLSLQNKLEDDKALHGGVGGASMKRSTGMTAVDMMANTRNLKVASQTDILKTTR
jgi:hypothetical protein